MPALTIYLKSSRQYTLLLCMAHFAVACILWKMDWSILIKLIGSILLAISLCLYLRCHALLLSVRSIVTLHFSEDGLTCTAQTQSNEHITFTIKSDTFVTPYLTVLCVKSPYSFFSRNIVIFPDSIDGDKFRQLRIWLRWKWRRK
jgi:toxin CptA